MAVPNTYRGFRVSRGDATGAQLALLVPTAYRVLHFASAADEATDWNVANPTHPTLYIHSETTPATDYGSLSHDGTDFIITAVGGGLRLAPVGDVQVDNTFGLIIGHTAQVTVSDGDGATNLIPELQVLGTAKADGSVVIASFNTTNDRTVSPSLNFLKGGNAAIGSNTIVASGESLGEIVWFGDDGVDYESPAASIRAEVDATPGTGDMPGRLIFMTTADGGETLTAALRINSAQAVLALSATGGLGYGTGAGGTVTQATNKSTGVTLNTVTGIITMNGAALAADTTVSFTLTNSAIAATDAVVVIHESAGTLGAYSFGSTAAAGSAVIAVHNNTPASLSEAIVLRFVVIKSVNA